MDGFFLARPVGSGANNDFSLEFPTGLRPTPMDETFSPLAYNGFVVSVEVEL
jgi:hypothetical protein